MKLYDKVAKGLRENIHNGLFVAGDKLPSIRQLVTEHCVSISTVQQAYHQLEMENLIEARPKSGYFVAYKPIAATLPVTSRPAQRPIEVSQWQQVLEVLLAKENVSTVQLQHAMPNMTVPSLAPLLKKMTSLMRHQASLSLPYGNIEGSLVLREQIAKLAAHSGCVLHPDDLVITSGCQEGLSVCLRSVTEPGDVVAVESPSFYGSMQAIKTANLKAIEIPTNAENGLSLEALELALEQWPIKSILVTPTCNNPMGYSMPEAAKKRLYQLAQSYDITIIEDDIYGDISYQSPRPKSIKSFDEDGRVLLCSSFSKTVAPGIRVGWIAPGRYRDKVTHVKYVSSSMCPTLPQLAIADFIKSGGYERHTRKVRLLYKQGRDHLIKCIKQHFPSDTRISFPKGGYILWVELNKRYDAVKLSTQCKQGNVSIAPGILFSATGKYRHCMRLNFSEKTEIEREQGIQQLGFYIAKQEQD
ncbi:PLP-dependent aminotransferase family protein [Psychromonas sp. SR45-3]|uniref:aminotransferase-like domain-containing protein n=1 Tax=Psychromonas sp. SR45-3 TaxID=2760930 RepID=UPI0015FDB473|nr:PLP-dependent aminotransferase family protein [Psychromonas sp. SR45-3]MBB1272450.1 PLP-dependent aminotransferase family protein [Psychromonas sp. SR45-3]